MENISTFFIVEIFAATTGFIGSIKQRWLIISLMSKNASRNLAPIYLTYPILTIQGVDFEGACYSQKENALFVCISVEETDEMNEDGNILGSFFGKIRLNNHIPKKIDYWPIVNSENQFLIAKFKSLCPSGNENTGHFFALYENGDSKTGFYQLNLQ